MASEPLKPQPRISLGEGVELDPSSDELYRAGRVTKLERIPATVLLLLVERRGGVVGRAEIVSRVWGKGALLDTDNGINSAIRKIRQALKDNPDSPRFIQTISGRGYRYIAPVSFGNDSQPQPQAIPFPVTAIPNVETETGQPKEPTARATGRLNWWIAVLGIFVLVATLVAWFYYRGTQRMALTDKDTVVLTEFKNTTGDPVFDETLKQALSIELTQSPFLSVASDLQVQEILRRMGRSPQDVLTRELASDVCLRMGGKAIFAGSISRFGSRYVVGLEALGCNNGATLAVAQAQAESKEGILKAVGEAASQVRRKVGESLPSLQKFDFAVNATTKSLEALRVFSLGLKTEHDSGPGDAIRFYQQAIQLDPDFALAYATLGRAYVDFGEDEEGIRNYSRAFQLRDRLSDREKYFLETLYYETALGDLEKAKQQGELWVSTYPRDVYAREKLATVYGDLGEIEKAYDQAREALRLEPESEVNIFNAVLGAITVDRLDEAERVLQTARSKGLDGGEINLIRYFFASRRGDQVEMERLVAWGTGKPVVGADLLCQHSESKAYYGQFREAEQLSARAAELATRDGAKEIAATCTVMRALREIEVGNVAFARETTKASLALAPTRNVKVLSALALAKGGESARALQLRADVVSQNPENTLVQNYWAAIITAALDLQAKNPQAALSELQTATPYELSSGGQNFSTSYMYPAYIRGQAYLAAHNGGAAAAEFKKILDHPGVVQNGILGALARLQLARAEVMGNDQVASRRDYEEFLSLWKNADADLPILVQAKAEYAKMQ